MPEDRLAAPLAWMSGARGQRTTRPCRVAAAHFLNRRTHHRGQAHCLLAQVGARPEDTDLPWMVDLGALGLG
ncbi:hypothetical protein GCM10010964_08280 [Caldovatus sediminis]|uniref:Uncharacterized protein n=1 Tax=Caldovatus sediminis TaxID=2041189 RepID=A0A8J2Z983_9PROT|nr:DinB family protein [Caldovatus sediminis]GGG22453.1 hypothetical protein GCM10010964_08280 [Caldovatus sediminis]